MGAPNVVLSKRETGDLTWSYMYNPVRMNQEGWFGVPSSFGKRSPKWCYPAASASSVRLLQCDEWPRLK